ncbi:unnamed protein product [Macrosiphum euphorbiae]|uniref:Uncharacterized protein n=1 Tax=Macrosiphum euphorbiae TaxID=13131 RepID=A0AAV0W5W5_9HEMI|nr:unnamed protein product [Macrosiphum euphorbiae]
MIVTKHTLRLLVGVLVIYCCIETTVGGSIRGVLNQDEPTPYTTLSPSQTEQSSDPTMSDTTVSPTTVKKHHLPTSIMPHKRTTTTTTTTEIPS